MGCLVSVECNCGYETQATVGAGMASFMTSCRFPFHCPQCRQVVDSDLMAATPACPRCGNKAIVPYTDPRLLGEPGTQEVVDWNLEGQDGGRVSLSDGTYHCPACEKPTLRFSFAGCFD